MNKEELLTLLKNKSSKIDLSGENIEGLKSNLIHIDKNEILFKPGDQANSFYFVISGEVMTSKNDDIKIFGEKEYFGFESLENNLERNRKAIGVKPSVILEFILHDKKISKQKNDFSRISSTGSVTKLPEQSLQDEKLSLPRNYTVEFDSVKHNDILIIFVNLSKATLIYTNSFIKHIDEEIKQGHKNFIIDLRACSLIDSSFLGSLVKSLREIHKIEGKMVLVYKKQHQSTLFMITYMDQVFETFNDMEEAIIFFEKN